MAIIGGYTKEDLRKWKHQIELAAAGVVGNCTVKLGRITFTPNNFRAKMTVTRTHGAPVPPPPPVKKEYISTGDWCVSDPGAFGKKVIIGHCIRHAKRRSYGTNRKIIVKAAFDKQWRVDPASMTKIKLENVSLKLTSEDFETGETVSVKWDDGDTYKGEILGRIKHSTGNPSNSYLIRAEDGDLGIFLGSDISNAKEKDPEGNDWNCARAFSRMKARPLGDIGAEGEPESRLSTNGVSIKCGSVILARWMLINETWCVRINEGAQEPEPATLITKALDKKKVKYKGVESL